MILQFRLSKFDLLHLHENYNVINTEKYYYGYLTRYGVDTKFIYEGITFIVSLITYNELFDLFKTVEYTDSCYLSNQNIPIFDKEYNYSEDLNFDSQCMTLVTNLDNTCISLPRYWNDIFFKLDNKFVICNEDSYILSNTPIISATPVHGYNFNYPLRN